MDIVAAADRTAIDVARAIERAVQYGLNTEPLNHTLDEVQAQQHRLRAKQAAGRLNGAHAVFGPVPR